jgi:hypothetical protein
MANFIQKAKEFLSRKESRNDAFATREMELRGKIVDLDSKKSKLLGEYDPTKPFDSKAIDKIDADIVEVNKELYALTESKLVATDSNIDDLIVHAEEIRVEFQEVSAKKIAAEAKAREKIAEAKKEFLQAQADHNKITRESKDYTFDVNETIQLLSKGINGKISELRREAQLLERQIYDLASSTTFNVVNGAQSQLDIVQAEYDAKRQEINTLEAYTREVGIGIAPLDNHRINGGQTTYYVHAKEQFDAVDHGIVK